MEGERRQGPGAMGEPMGRESEQQDTIRRPQVRGRKQGKGSVDRAVCAWYKAQTKRATGRYGQYCSYPPRDMALPWQVLGLYVHWMRRERCNHGGTYILSFQKSGAAHNMQLHPYQGDRGRVPEMLRARAQGGQGRQACKRVPIAVFPSATICLPVPTSATYLIFVAPTLPLVCEPELPPQELSS